MLPFEKLYNKMLQKNIQALLITNKLNWRYLCGFTGSNGLLIVTEKKNYLIIDGRYTEQAMLQTRDVTIYTLKSKENFWSVASELLNNMAKIGIERNNLSYSDFLSLTEFIDKNKIINTVNIVESLRMLKTPEEIQYMKKAAEITDKTFSYITKVIKPGMTELEVANEIDYFSKKNGSEGAAFETIVASGKRTALPHAHASEKIIKKNELMMLDFGCIVNGYYSDMTRTFALGEVSQQIKDSYNLLLQCQKYVIENLKLGLTLSEIDQNARKYLKKYNQEQYFTHGLGHGIGLSCHEYPYLNETSKTILQANMTFAIEPGIYYKNQYGIRIEDDVYLNQQGKINVLTKSNKEWMSIACH